MSTVKRKAKPRAKAPNRFRNAGAPVVRPPRARPEGGTNGALPGQAESPAWHLVHTAVGAGLASAIGAYATRWGFAPRTVAATLGAVSGYAAYTRDTARARSFSAGAASAAGSQILLLTLKPAVQPATAPASPTVIVAQSHPTTQRKNSDLGALPPGALDAAFERARAQLAISGDMQVRNGSEHDYEHDHVMHHDHVPFGL